MNLVLMYLPDKFLLGITKLENLTSIRLDIRKIIVQLKYAVYKMHKMLIFFFFLQKIYNLYSNAQ